MVTASPSLLTNRYTSARVNLPVGGQVTPALDTTQIFYLIDSYLPFEVCLHYQLLPLGIDRDRVHLGMVDPHDRSALEYAVRMAQYWNYRLIPKPISHDSLHTLLAAYLNFIQLQGPTAHQEKLRLASQVAQGQSGHHPSHRASSLAPDPVPPDPPPTMLLINDETLILDEAELMAIEASESAVLPLSGHTSPAVSQPQPDHTPLPHPPPTPVRGGLPTAPVAPPTPVSKPCQLPQATQAPRPSPSPQPTKPNQPPQSQPRPNQPTPPAQPPTQQQLDQLGKAALQLTRQLRQTMHSLQDYGTAHPAQVQRRQQAIAALGRDLHQINQDFRELWHTIAAQKVS